MRRSSGRWICCLLPRHPLMAKLVKTTNDLAWISSRDKMVGQLEGSAAKSCEASGLWPKYLPPKSNRATDNDMYFVDELSVWATRVWTWPVPRSG